MDVALSDYHGALEYLFARTTGAFKFGLERARALLAEEGLGARVVSMPSWEVFAAQDESYREEVLPPSITARVSIEAAATFGWERWIGDRGIAIGVDRFGSSAPGEVNMREYGITAETAAEAVRRVVRETAPR